MEKRLADVEAPKEAVVDSTGVECDIGSTRPAYHSQEIQDSIPFLKKLHKLEKWMDEKLGGEGMVETRGIDRIAEGEKQPPPIWNAFFIWPSFIMHVGTIPIGVLGAEFGLSLYQSMAAAVVGVAAGACFPAATGLLGPKLGMRQIATSRYSFGFWGAKLCSVLNVVVGGGFAVVNTVVVGQILSAVSNFSLPLTVGCIIIAVLSYAVSIFGFRLIHLYERWSWGLALVLFIVLYAQCARHADVTVPPVSPGLAGTGLWLSFMTICFSTASGWCTYGADYYCNYPANVSKFKLATLTWAGIMLPTFFSISLGITLGNAALMAEYGPYLTAYTDHGLGGLMLIAYHPEGWAKTALVLSIFTIVGSNVATNYSSGLSIQLLGHWFHAVPRFIWSFLVALSVAAVAIAGRQHLSTIISNFVSLLGYWAVCFTLILAIEDAWFRRHDGYDLDAWDRPQELPWGVAATFTLIVAYCAGGVTGMSQSWHVGVIAAKFGPYGGDVGIFLSGAITLVVYPLARYVEKKWTGR